MSSNQSRVLTICSKPRMQLRLAILALLIASLACSMPGAGQRATPSQQRSAQALETAAPAAPTPTPLPLPPALVESNPPPGAALSLGGALTLYFNQPMQRASVESALAFQPALTGDFRWDDDSTLVFQPAQPLAPESDLTVSLDTAARSADGLALQQPVSLSFRTASFLRLAQTLPDDGAMDVDPTSAVVATFTQPVVPLGADPAGLPRGFELQPPASGNGEWLNTSTYIFYPAPALAAGTAYTVALNPALTAADGAPLEEAEDWSFSTALPYLVLMQPAPDQSFVALDTPITLTFNIPMDAASVEANFALLDPNGNPLSGASSWDENYKVFTFQPDQLLGRSAGYAVTLSGQAQATGGASLGSDFRGMLWTVTPLAVASSDPAPGGQKQQYAGVTLYFNGPINGEKAIDYISISPKLPNLGGWYDNTQNTFSIYGEFEPETIYTLSVSPELPDPWGGTLGAPYVLTFSTSPLPPQIYLTTGSDVLFLTPRDGFLSVQAANISSLPVALGSLELSRFFDLVSGPDSYNQRQTYRSPDETGWFQPMSVSPNRFEPADLYLSPDRAPLGPGLYYLRIDMPPDQGLGGPYLIVVSDIQVMFKLGATDALVWAVDLRTNQPVSDAPVTLYDPNGQGMAEGRTDAQGVFRTTISPLKDPYNTYYAVVGPPGGEDFGMAISTWNQGLSSWDFGLNTDYSGPRLKAYMYTDRPIYRPGQTVYFRAILRQAFNGRYTLPDLGSLPLSIKRDYSQEVATFDLPVSAFGTAHGEYTLPEDARPGAYYFTSSLDEYSTSLVFQVAEYRKPEINLQVGFDTGEAQSGDALRASVNARYFFDAPVSNIPVHWVLYSRLAYIDLPGYQVGPADTSWLDVFRFNFPRGPLGNYLQEGNGTTDAQGLLDVEIPTEVSPVPQIYTLEVTLTDDSGLQVSARSEITVHPASFYIGLRADNWTVQAGQKLGFDVQTADWQANPGGVHSLHASFEQVEWVRSTVDEGTRFPTPKYTPVYTPVSSVDLTTNPEGQARLEFTPPEPGNYMLTLEGEGARSQISVWVGGAGQAVWPTLPNQRLHLVADRSGYKPGDTARIFLPNPFSQAVQALISVERSVVLRYQVVQLDPGGNTVQLPLSSEDAPNVYVSITLLGKDNNGLPDYRQGYLNLPVEPVEQVFNVTLTSQPQRAGPGQEVNFEIQVTDSAGSPVQGEFSLSVVDLAALALADPNAPDIAPAFYNEQPLGVRSGMTLAAYARRSAVVPAGGGGGDGSVGPTVVRDRFPDTAYWNAEITTGPDGRAQVSAPLPDNLTTWKVLVRGVTPETRVGQAELEIVATKELLVRPETPRFLVAGDHVLLSGIVHNNTAAAMDAQVSLQASGVVLDDAASATQVVTVSAGGRASVGWWATVQDGTSADLVFSATAQQGGVTYQDASRPALGALPVLRYTASQTFSTSGTLDEGGQRLELVSLPRTFDANAGSLRVELASSLAGAMMSGLDALEHYRYETTETTLSRFLPNLEAYRVLQEFGIDNPSVQTRLERTLQKGLNRLLSSQNGDFGWSWWSEGESDPFLTAYVLFGLARARLAGVEVSDEVFQNTIQYLNASLWTPEMSSESWQLDRLVFMHFALAQAGAGNLPAAEALFAVRDRLSSWAQALLALTLEQLNPGSQQAADLTTGLSGSALRSATGAHWEENQPTGRNMGTPQSTTAMVLYTLAQRDPTSPLIADGVRYLMSSRLPNGSWKSSYATAWSLMALSEVLRATGELGGEFAFSAALNGGQLVSGQASSSAAPVSSEVPLDSLYTDRPNALTIQRDPGAGRLYYLAALEVSRPVEDVAPLQEGISISRAYYPVGAACSEDDCPTLQSAQVGDQVLVRVTLTLDQQAYYLFVEDFIPAGAEVLDTTLKTSQLGVPEPQPAVPSYDARRPFGQGWGWWLFSKPSIFDDHIAWGAGYLPAGTYELTYTLVINQPGEFRVLPAHAWQFYFPEVQGNSAGSVFAITPRPGG